MLIASYNTPKEYLTDCIKSILLQKNLGITFGIEIVWVNDGSNSEFTEYLEEILKFIKSQYIKIKYIKMHTNYGLSYCLHHGVIECSYNIIFRMDSDDIMHETRINKQLNVMNNNPNCVLSGTNIICFKKNINNKFIYIEKSNHPFMLTWNEYKQTKKQWILNHPTLCFRKYAVITVGNYNKNMKEPFEDLDLELRILKKYGFICNLSENLLYYRIHNKQITWTEKEKSKKNNQLKRDMIEQIIQSK
jgi:amylovoran biosynthesis glycosyltransferase AmsE